MTYGTLRWSVRPPTGRILSEDIDHGKFGLPGDAVPQIDGKADVSGPERVAATSERRTCPPWTWSMAASSTATASAAISSIAVSASSRFQSLDVGAK